MSRLCTAAIVLLPLLLTSCGSGTEIEFVDFSGTWTIDLIVPVPDAQAACVVTGITATVSQSGPAFTGSTTGGTLVCQQGQTTAPSEALPNLTIAAGVAGPAGTDEQDAVAFNAGSGSAVTLTFAGAPVPGGVVDFGGAVSGTLTIEAFDIGATTVTGTWEAHR